MHFDPFRMVSGFNVAGVPEIRGALDIIFGPDFLFWNACQASRWNQMSLRDWFISFGGTNLWSKIRIRAKVILVRRWAERQSVRGDRVYQCALAVHHVVLTFELMNLQDARLLVDQKSNFAVIAWSTGGYQVSFNTWVSHPSQARGWGVKGVIRVVECGFSNVLKHERVFNRVELVCIPRHCALIYMTSFEISIKTKWWKLLKRVLSSVRRGKFVWHFPFRGRTMHIKERGEFGGSMLQANILLCGMSGG